MSNQNNIKQLDKKTFVEYNKNKSFFDEHEFFYSDKIAKMADLVEYKNIKYELGYPFEIEYVDEFPHQIEHALYKMVLRGYFKQNFLNASTDGFLFIYNGLDSNIGTRISKNEPVTFKFNVFPIKKITVKRASVNFTALK